MLFRSKEEELLCSPPVPEVERFNRAGRTIFPDNLCRPVGIWEAFLPFSHHAKPLSSIGAVQRALRKRSSTAGYALCPAILGRVNRF